MILHEEAEDGNAMPDLARPVQIVKAVDMSWTILSRYSTCQSYIMCN